MRVLLRRRSGGRIEFVPAPMTDDEAEERLEPFAEVMRREAAAAARRGGRAAALPGR